MTKKEIRYLNDKFAGKEIMMRFTSLDKEYYWNDKTIIVTIKKIGFNLTSKGIRPRKFEVIIINKNLYLEPLFNSYSGGLIYKESVEKVLAPLLNCTVQKIDYLNSLIQYKVTQGKRR